MRIGRPVNSNTIYKVGIHTNGKHRYASTQPFTVGADGKKRYLHKHWGTVDENNIEDVERQYGATWLLDRVAERRSWQTLTMRSVTSIC